MGVCRSRRAGSQAVFLGGAVEARRQMAGKYLARPLPAQQYQRRRVHSHGAGRVVCAQRVWPVRYGRKRLGVVPRLVPPRLLRREPRRTPSDRLPVSSPTIRPPHAVCSVAGRTFARWTRCVRDFQSALAAAAIPRRRLAISDFVAFDRPTLSNEVFMPAVHPLLAGIETAHKNWGWFLVLGIVLIILGTLALGAPMLVSL